MPFSVRTRSIHDDNFVKVGYIRVARHHSKKRDRLVKKVICIKKTALRI